MLYRFSHGFSLFNKSRLSSLFWDQNLPWRQFGLYTFWTAFKACCISPQLETEGRTELQDLSLGLLCLSYLTTDPEPSEALVVVRLATVVSVTDSLARLSPPTVASQQERKVVSTFCSLCRLGLVAVMGLGVFNRVLLYEQ